MAIIGGAKSIPLNYVLICKRCEVDNSLCENCGEPLEIPNDSKPLDELDKLISDIRHDEYVAYDIKNDSWGDRLKGYADRLTEIVKRLA